ncbi:unnamed protein product [Ilex paraguariensis]|uniref:Uncharacterized protein n=1 Tax=Ilex paraguariensis TaxID=185542 RepID=A0ABC8RDT7_9AQUA
MISHRSLKDQFPCAFTQKGTEKKRFNQIPREVKVSSKPCLAYTGQERKMYHTGIGMATDRVKTT